jgi:hypothetical protein
VTKFIDFDKTCYEYYATGGLPTSNGKLFNSFKSVMTAWQKLEILSGKYYRYSIQSPGMIYGYIYETYTTLLQYPYCALGKGEGVPVHAIKACINGEEVQLCLFLTSTKDEFERSTSRLQCVRLGKELQYQPSRRLGGTNRRCGILEKRKNSKPCRDSNPAWSHP